MKYVLRTITIIILILGLTGIILGISVGLYRSDQLARLQEAGVTNSNAGLAVQDSSQQASHASASLYDYLLHTNVHTLLLAVGTLLTLFSAALFLIGIRKDVE
jgi:hypothetical protein